MNTAIKALIEAAQRAPSGDNTQPWRFEADDEQVTMHLDPSRDPSHMNAGQRMARIACGAALENMRRTALRNSWKNAASIDPTGKSAAVQLNESHALQSAADIPMFKRSTNRRMYNGMAVSEFVRRRLVSSVPAQDGIRAIWLWDRKTLDAFAQLEAKAFSLFYGCRETRQAILGNVRFDRPHTEEVEEGLSTGSLELNKMEGAAFKFAGKAPDWAVRGLGILSVMSAHVKKLVRSSSGLCIVLAPGFLPADDWRVGQVMQRAWVALTEQGLTAQPMMTVPVLENMQVECAASNPALPDQQKVAKLLAEWPKICPEAANERVAFVLRVGYAPEPTSRTGRRSADIKTRRKVTQNAELEAANA